MKRLILLCFGLALGLAASLECVRAATLSNVPMQGTMVMPMIKFDAASARLRVTLDPTVPELTPLLVSNPGDGFDPADPWYDLLDPKRQGLAFSRRYGFVMDATTDPLPDGARIWLRKLSSSDGLKIYRYRSSTPKAWTPIFGTDGSPAALEWDGMMFHPGFAASPVAGACSARFEAVLVDADSGLEVPDAGTGPFEMNWTILSDGRPVLNIGWKVVIAGTDAPGFVLEAAEKFDPSNWVAVTNTPVMIGGQSAVVLDPIEARKFYRMRRTE